MQLQYQEYSCTIVILAHLSSRPDFALGVFIGARWAQLGKVPAWMAE